MMVSIMELLIITYIFIVAGYIIGSWFPKVSNSSVYHFITKIVDPPLSLLRKFVPKIKGVDITPSVLIFLLYGIMKLIEIAV